MVAPAAAGQGGQNRSVVEHFSKGYLGLNHLGPAFHIHTLDLTRRLFRSPITSPANSSGT